MEIDKKEPGTYFDEKTKEKAQQAFEHITDEVSVCAFLQPECSLSDKIKIFLDELSTITNKIPITIHLKNENPDLENKYKVEMFPFIAVINKAGEYTRIGYHGVPAGFELEAFISAIRNITIPEQSIVETTLSERISQLKTPLSLKIGISMTCIRCPELVISCQQLALLNTGITAEMLDLNHFKDLAKKFKIMSIPALIINNDKVRFGGKTLEELVSELENI